MTYFAALILLMICNTLQAQPKSRYELVTDSLMRTGQAAKVLPYLQKEVRLKPKNEGLLRLLGFAYTNSGQLDTGERYYREAIAVNPKCARCYANVGLILAMKKDSKNAYDYFDRSIATDPKDATPYSARAQVKASKGDNLGAIADLDKAIELDPKNAELYLQRGKYNALQAYFSLAVADMDKAVALMPDQYMPYFARAELYYNKLMHKEALADMEMAIHLDSTVQALYNGRGAIYVVFKDHDKAIADFNRSIALNPKDYFPYFYRARENYALEDMEGYCTDIHQAYALAKSNNLTLDSDTRNELEYGIATLCDSTKSAYYYQRGIAFYNRQQYQKALEIYTAGLKKLPGNSMALSFRGNAYFSLKEYALALSDYAASIKNVGNLSAEIANNQKHTGLAGASIETYKKEFISSMQISIAESKFALGLYNDALEAINEGISIAPDMKEYGRENYYNVRGNIYLAMGKYQSALDDFEDCIRANPRFALGYVNRAIAGVNIAETAPMKSYIITGGLNDQSFNANWSLPVKTATNKSNAALLVALTDCNTAIEIDPKFDYAYYIRGQAKRSLAYSNYCDDLLHAKELGYPVEAEALVGCGK